VSSFVTMLYIVEYLQCMITAFKGRLLKTSLT